MKTGFWSKTTVFGKNHSFQTDLSSETAKTTFPTQPSTGQHQTLKSMDFSVKQKTNWVHNTNIGVTLLGKTPMNFGQNHGFSSKSAGFDENHRFQPKTMDFAVSVWFFSLKLENC